MDLEVTSQESGTKTSSSYIKQQPLVIQSKHLKGAMVSVCVCQGGSAVGEAQRRDILVPSGYYRGYFEEISLDSKYLNNR